MRSNTSFEPGECGCSASEMALGASCESGQKKFKKKLSETYKKKKIKENTIPGPKQHVRTCFLGLENVDIACRRWLCVRCARVARKN